MLLTTAKWLIGTGVFFEVMAIVIAISRNREEVHATDAPPPAPVALEGVSSGQAMMTGRSILGTSALSDWRNGVERTLQDMQRKIELAERDRSQLASEIRNAEVRSRQYATSRLETFASQQRSERRGFLTIDAWSLSAFALGAVLQGVGSWLSLLRL